MEESEWNERLRGEFLSEELITQSQTFTNSTTHHITAL